MIFRLVNHLLQAAPERPKASGKHSTELSGSNEGAHQVEEEALGLSGELVEGQQLLALVYSECVTLGFQHVLDEIICFSNR